MADFDESDVQEIVALAKAKTGTPMDAFKLLQRSVKLVFTDRVREVRNNPESLSFSEPTAEMFVLQALDEKDNGKGVHYDNILEFCTGQGLTSDAAEDAIQTLELEETIKQVDDNVFKVDQS